MHFAEPGAGSDSTAQCVGGEARDALLEVPFCLSGHVLPRGVDLGRVDETVEQRGGGGYVVVEGRAHDGDADREAQLVRHTLDHLHVNSDQARLPAVDVHHAPVLSARWRDVGEQDIRGGAEKVLQRRFGHECAHMQRGVGQRRPLHVHVGMGLGVCCRVEGIGYFIPMTTLQVSREHLWICGHICRFVVVCPTACGTRRFSTQTSTQTAGAFFTALPPRRMKPQCCQRMACAFPSECNCSWKMAPRVPPWNRECLLWLDTLPLPQRKHFISPSHRGSHSLSTLAHTWPPTRTLVPTKSCCNACRTS